MTAQQPERVSRRRVVAGLVASPALVLAACSVSPIVRATSVAEVPDPDARRRWNAIRVERDLAALLTATAAAHPGLAEPLTTYADLHRTHVTTLRDEGPLPRLADHDDDVAPPEVASSTADARAAVADAEDAAVASLVAACGASQGARLATVLASIAASDGSIATMVRSL